MRKTQKKVLLYQLSVNQLTSAWLNAYAMARGFTAPPAEDSIRVLYQPTVGIHLAPINAPGIEYKTTLRHVHHASFDAAQQKIEAAKTPSRNKKGCQLYQF